MTAPTAGEQVVAGVAGQDIVYELTVTASLQAPGRISDEIHIETDSPIRPTLQVPVYGTIIEASKEPS